MTAIILHEYKRMSRDGVMDVSDVYVKMYDDVYCNVNRYAFTALSISAAAGLVLGDFPDVIDDVWDRVNDAFYPPEALG
jgi:hypothetical protein